MDTIMAPSYTNLFVEKLEQEFLHTQDKLPLIWWRWMDDVFAVRTHSELYLCSFLENLNTYEPHVTINYTSSWSTEEVTFLDTQVYIKNGLLETNLRVNPTDTHQYFQVNC